MTISSAMSNALGGMTYNVRTAEVIASNVANASNDAYSKREFDNGLVKRITNPVLLSDRRLSDAEVGLASGGLKGAQKIEQVFGTIEDAGSISSSLAAFDSALVLAASDPSSTLRLEAVVDAANDLTAVFNAKETELQDIRRQADSTIASQVEHLNAKLEEVANLNHSISVAKHGDVEVSGLRDQRQKALDEIAELVPIRTVARDRGELTVYTEGGAILVGDKAAVVGFDETPTIAAHMTQANGMLGGLTLNGRNVSLTDSGPFAGGAIAAQFLLRDETVPEYQQSLDAAAQELALRFESGGPDGTIAAGAPGLFTDMGNVTAPPSTGLAGRLQLNSAVTAEDAWRIRDGIYAPANGEVGDPTVLNSMLSSLNGTSGPQSVSGSLSDMVLDLENRAVSARVRFETQQSAATDRNISLREIELSEGVDTDQELQNLMLVERAYAANAQVLQTLDDLITRLLEM